MEREVEEEEGERRRLAITSLEPQVDQLRESVDNTSLCLMNGEEIESQAHPHFPMTMTEQLHMYKTPLCLSLL